jgi:hypothetical protein
VFEKPHWRTVLATKDKAKAEAMANELPRGTFVFTRGFFRVSTCMA